MEGNATGGIADVIIDKAGEEQPVKTPIVVVAGLGRNFFPVPPAILQGTTAMFAADAPRVETGSFSLPLKQVVGACDLYSFEMELDAPELAFQATRVSTADNWHLRNVGLAVAVHQGTSTERTHKTKASLHASNPFGLHRPHGANFTYSAGRLRVRKQDHRRVHHVDGRIPRPDQTGSRKYDPAAREIARDTHVEPHCCASCGSRNAVYWKLFSGVLPPNSDPVGIGCTNTTIQISVGDRVERSLVGMTRIMLVDGDLPKYLWGGLMKTTAYLSNRSPLSALGMETPYSKRFGKEADLSLKIIGAWASVHLETYTKTSDNKALEGRLCGYCQESKAYRVYSPPKRKVVDSRNVVFIQKPLHIVSPPQDSDYHDTGWRTMNDNDELYNNDDNPVRDIGTIHRVST